ncbi:MULTISPECIES: glycerol kinase GlpK [Rhizobium/Agrobacterium group]|uniref:glycerol kinase GlpK n=1 Tax=Rhizobium/Agrobacterium group TaxID=227290 RepID=UPI0003F1E409|nr:MULTISPECIES: glycerol kinase GlpK [Rhizobium/Agrobacterium group]AHK03681.1 glycerol kinase [Agrobacterium tumefaciens LBA4213 (Ach5)]AKC09442.1 glycerol kinase [Agrobacterium tumefaciens]AYM18585.1 glycerol kinase [Agrobacterium tumefaciens]AYM69884.1 glycerol kinase [Agrobacterium tumefaciens]NIB56380.1 glycerol kinase GlpK [Agrobacterium tumefaciens]
MGGYILAIDQGTTSTRSMVFDRDMRVIGVGQREFPQHFPASGWVEHDAEDIWKSVLETIRLALADAGMSASDIEAIGITNQRETTVLWDRNTGEAVHRAVVWQDRRAAPICEDLKRRGLEPLFSKKTGLLLDPYFSGTKLKWLLDSVSGLREKAVKGEICFGTVDSFLIYRLTGGRRHVTDATNASRTLIYNIEDNAWDDELLSILDIPRAMLPEVLDCAADFGVTDKALLGAEIPILGVAGDQQAAVIGNACFEPGMMKSTYGTGCFALLNTGTDRVASTNRLLTTIAYRLDGVTTYALEGSIFIAGAAVQWLRDELGFISVASEVSALAEKADPKQRVYLVPAFTGLGAPYWDAEARGAIFGLTRGTGPAEFARAALESVAYQTFDLLDAMRNDWAGDNGKTVLRVDGGMVASDWTMQRLADILAAPVDRPVFLETTILGAAWLAASRAGIWPDREAFAAHWKRDRRFLPDMDETERKSAIAGWRDSVGRCLSKRED